MIIVELDYGDYGDHTGAFRDNTDWGVIGPWSWDSIPMRVGDTYEFTGVGLVRYRGVITEIVMQESDGRRYPGHSHYCRVRIPHVDRIDTPKEVT